MKGIPVDPVDVESIVQCIFNVDRETRSAPSSRKVMDITLIICRNLSRVIWGACRDHGFHEIDFNKVRITSRLPRPLADAFLRVRVDEKVSRECIKSRKMICARTRRRIVTNACLEIGAVGEAISGKPAT